MQQRPLTDVERNYLAAIRVLSRSRGRFGIGAVAVQVARMYGDDVGHSRSWASKVVNRLAEFKKIDLAPHFDGCVRAISLPKRKPKRRKKGGVR